MAAHFSTDVTLFYSYLHYDAGNNQSQITVDNQPMRSQKQLNELLELALSFNVLFDQLIETTITIEKKHW